MNDDDRKLGKAFEALRREDARQAPSFEDVRQRRRRRARPSPWVVAVPAASMLAAAAVFVVWCRTERPEASSSPVAAAPPPAATAAPGAPMADPLGGGVPSDGIVALAPVVTARPPEAPLDFLLDVPGLAVRGIPDFDTSSLRGSLR